jgi:aryl-alcohol dehydrogenase-like predicted oxidoreductase
VIDLYQIHWPPENDGPELEESWQALVDLQKQGKVRWIGVSNYSVDQIKRIEKIAPVTSDQPPYSILRRKIESDLLPYCEQRGIGIINYSPMLSGMLTGGMTRERALNLPDDDWRKGKPEFTEPRLSKNLELVERLKVIGARHKRSAGEVAIAWTLRLPAVTGAIVGARNAKQAEGVMTAGELKLTPKDLAEIEGAAAAQAAR